MPIICDFSNKLFTTFKVQMQSSTQLLVCFACSLVINMEQAWSIHTLSRNYVTYFWSYGISCLLIHIKSPTQPTLFITTSRPTDVKYRSAICILNECKPVMCGFCFEDSSHTGKPDGSICTRHHRVSYNQWCSLMEDNLNTRSAKWTIFCHACHVTER